MRLPLPDLSPQSIPLKALAPAAFLVAGGLSLLAAVWAAREVERRSLDGVSAALLGAGQDWAQVATDGLKVTLIGTAPSETERFHALTLAASVVDADRVIDAMDVVDPMALKAPDFTIEILRNGDGISLIGLVPAGEGHDALISKLSELVRNGEITDMLEAAEHPVPASWDEAVAFGINALAQLPRSKISILADRVSVTAISDSAAEKARLEAELSRSAPDGLHLVLDISAPRPVITPFTLRFLIDERGARFDACSADSEAARDRILAAATEAGATRKNACTIGLGVPTPVWSDAVTMALAAMKELGAGSVTFSDADISLIAADTVGQEDFDRVVGELESNLPQVFSLHAVLTPKPVESTDAPLIPEFTATLGADGRLDLRGRLGDALSRDAVESLARARFGTGSVHAATRLAPGMPAGWPVRVMTALEALGELDEGRAQVRPEIIRIEGVTGSTTASDTVARLLSSKLGEAQNYELSIRYDAKRDPLLGLPTEQECVTEINAILAARKIAFEPGSAQITADGKETIDRIAERMKECTDFPMEIGGHTDSQGREEMNLQLSSVRAQAIVTALMDRRVLTGNLVAKGYGETVPIGDNTTEEGREANRRIEFRLLSSEVAPAVAAAGDATTEAAPEPPVVVQAPGEATPRPKLRPDPASGN